MKCPKCNSTGEPSVAFDYKFPILVPCERPYETVWNEWFVWACYNCGTRFVSKEPEE